LILRGKTPAGRRQDRRLLIITTSSSLNRPEEKPQFGGCKDRQASQYTKKEGASIRTDHS
jgi:hypothetical protein